MMGMSTKVRYATRAQIARAVQAARDNGVIVSSVEMQRDGTIRVSSAPVSSEPAPQTLFDKLDAQGRL